MRNLVTGELENKKIKSNKCNEVQQLSVHGGVGVARNKGGVVRG